MNAITIKLPWAATIRAGKKLVENRGRPVNPRHIGQRILIHAGAAWSKDGAADPRIREWWWGPTWDSRPPLDATDFSYLFRHIIAEVTLADCHQAATPINEALTCCQPWGNRNYGADLAWHLVFTDVEAYEPGDPRFVPAVGRLSVPWTLPDGAVA